MKRFIVKAISGEYATLVDDDNEELFIALALLPLDIDIDTVLSYDGIEFSILP